MRRRKSRLLMYLVAGIAAFVAFSLPVYPSSWAKPPAVKVMADNVRHQIWGDFAKGKNKNVKMELEGKQTVLTPKQTDQDAVYTSPVIRSSIVFTDVGVHWKNRAKNKIKAQANTRIDVRFSSDGHHWSSWKEAEVDADMTPGPGHSTETFSQLIYANNGRYFQYRVQMHPDKNVVPRIKDIQVTFINSRDGKKVESKKSFWDILFEKVHAAVNKPDIVSRAEWGADESLRYNADGTEKWPREYHSVSHIFVHHTDTPNNDPDPAARVRAIYYYHAVTKGWGDIAYNAIIGSDGRIYEGRKGQDNDVLTNGVVGAGTYGFTKAVFPSP